jgi:caffeoyl-CoA O-methyltransferase
MEIESILKTIESFDTVFNDTHAVPPYERAWELNRNHGIKLNCLPKESALYIQNLIKERKPATILEIGTSGGYSALHMAVVAQEYGGEIYTIEKSAPKAEIARVHFAQSKLPNIHLLEEDAKEIIANWTKPIDFLFIDADRKQYKNFLISLEPHLSPGATIIADNVINYKSDVEDFLSYITSNTHYDTELLTFDNGLIHSRTKEDVDEREDNRKE